MHFEVVILGAGSAGEYIATTLAQAGRSVALIEKLRVGGECAYVSCIPSKAMLRSTQVRNIAKNLVSLGGASREVVLDDDQDGFRAAAERRDRIAEFRDDTTTAARAAKMGVQLFRGNGVFTGVDRIEVGQEELSWNDIILATGSTSTIPEIEGLDEIEYWTSDVALSVLERPKSVLIVGGGPVGCELAQIFSRFGAETFIVQFSDQLAGKEHPEIAMRLAENLRAEGVKIILNTNVIKVEQTSDNQVLVLLSDQSSHKVERVIIAAGRHPNTKEIGIELLGIALTDEGAVQVDDHCRVVGQDHVWAAGDVTGVAPFTHTANYQGRIIANNLMGVNEVADYSAIPRAIYTDPPLASVGIMKSTEHEDGLITAQSELSQGMRNVTDGSGGGLVILTADPVRGILVGASAIGPQADEWISEATLAIRAKIHLSILSDVVHAFPTYGESFEEVVRKLYTQVQLP